MKTKYILHGGFVVGNNDENNTLFYKEILKSAPQKPKILLVFFAKDIEQIPVGKEKVMAELNKNKWQAEIVSELASEDSFVKQVESSDVIYINGGVTSRLLDVLKKFRNLDKLFKGKIIVGESAGAIALCKFFYSPNADAIFDGLGLLPLKIIPHYSEKYKDKIDELDKLDNTSELLLLPEYQFKVFEI